MAIDYSRFDSVGDEDDDVAADVKRAKESKAVENARDTHYARGLLADPLLTNVFAELHQADDMHVKIKPSEAEMADLLGFIAVQQYNGGAADNTLSAVSV